jgi:hypothetical protein
MCLNRFPDTCGLSCAIILACCSVSFGQPRVIYSDINTSPTSLVPDGGVIRFTSFDRPYRSLDGQNWAITGVTDGTHVDEVIVYGSGLVGTLGDHQNGTDYGGGEFAGLIDRTLSIRNDGAYCYATNTNGATTTDEIIACHNPGAGTRTVPAREGGAAPGIANAFLGLTIHSPTLTTAGAVGYVSSNLTGAGVTTATNAGVFLGGGLVAQKGVTVPTGQLDGGSRAWEFFDNGDTYFSADGAHHSIMGDLVGGSSFTDDVLVVDGAVKIQEGFVIPGSGFGSAVAVDGIREGLITPSGVWLARGENADDGDWVVINGAVVAKTGDLVPGGVVGETFSKAIFDATFFGMAANNVGDYVYGGTTSLADPEFDSVLVWNDLNVVARQGDPVDLDGNGLTDDNVFLDVFNDEDLFLTDDNWLYFTADLRDGASTSIGQAYLRLTVPEPATLAFTLCGAMFLLRRRRA